MLLQILKLVHGMSAFKLTPKAIAEESREEAETTAKVNLRWILFKLRKAVNVEVAKAPNSTNIVSIFCHSLDSCA